MRYFNQFLMTGIVACLTSFTFADNSQFNEVSTLGNVDLTNGDGVSVSPSGDVYISGARNGNIKKITIDGAVSEFASGFKSLNGSDFDSKGNLFVSAYADNQVIRFTPDGTFTVFADNLDGPAGLVIDKNDNVIVTLYGSNFSGKGASVLQFTPKGEKTIIAQGQGLKDVIGVAIDENGYIYAGNYKDRKIFKIKDSTVTLLARADVNVNQIDYFDGYIYVANETIINSVSLDGEVEIFAGDYDVKIMNGNIKDARFLSVNSLAFNDDHSILYVYDKYTGDVRKIFNK